MLIKALWIDDQPNDAFVDNAELSGIIIEVRKNVDDGIKELLANPKVYDAIILDANCISHNDGTKEPKVSALSYALSQINCNNIKLPWFVYSGGGFEGENAISIIVEGYERPYDDKSWYRKPIERKELFDKIVDIVSNSNIYKIKEKYSDILGVIPELDKRLLKVLIAVENGITSDPDILIEIRKSIEIITAYILPDELKLCSLNDRSKIIGKTTLTIVPSYIKDLFYAIVRIVQPQAHTLPEEDALIKGEAPYLIKTATYGLCNILYWCKNIIENEENLKLFRETTPVVYQEIKEKKH